MPSSMGYASNAQRHRPAESRPSRQAFTTASPVRAAGGGLQSDTVNGEPRVVVLQDARLIPTLAMFVCTASVVIGGNAYSRRCMGGRRVRRGEQGGPAGTAAGVEASGAPGRCRVRCG